MHGESVVMRLLDRGGAPAELGALGIPHGVLDPFRRALQRPHGLLLVTGPTGSGKTTTLYASLAERSPTREKIITVEDPVEYDLPGVTQVPVHRAAGVAFGTALRAILRQDPDVLMIGETRDRETAEIALQAAMTGHLVLTTLHTNDAISAIPRLMDLGIADYLIAGTVEGILAQRLVRRLCPSCSVETEDEARVVANLLSAPSGGGTSRKARGCPDCRGTGYRGRTGIFEYVRMTEAMRACLVRGGALADLRAVAIDEGFADMRRHGWELISAGVTTIDEVLRVVDE